MYRVTASGKTRDINPTESGYQVDGERVDFDVVQTGTDTFHILLNHQSFNARLHRLNRNLKQVELEVNNELIQLTIEDDFDALLVKMGIDKDALNKVSEIKAPMPGLVLSVQVNPGDEVEEGQALLVLEAMKMENVLNAPGAAIVKSVIVTSGQKVDKNDVLITFE
ncbi:MAG: biotin attachment protein [Flavobacteriales bacterium]|nr:biotin/lipoyl-binding protein [Bacteroidota bacterium]MCB9241345.1 biotin attachment protein [Flavobacteriales bacterium]